jgi:hypothetical protein
MYINRSSRPFKEFRRSIHIYIHMYIYVYMSIIYHIYYICYIYIYMYICMYTYALIYIHGDDDDNDYNEQITNICIGLLDHLKNSGGAVIVEPKNSNTTDIKGI